jgi:hypothetical protein
VKRAEHVTSFPVDEYYPEFECRFLQFVSTCRRKTSFCHVVAAATQLLQLNCSCSLASCSFCCDFEAGALLTRATEDVRLYIANLPTYEAKWLFIVTWHNVTYGGGSSTTKASRSFSNKLEQQLM